MIGRTTSAALLMVCLRTAASAAESPVFQEFEKRVAAYVELRKGIEANLPALKSTASPEKISSEQRELGRAVRGMRKNAKPGDIFTAEIAAEIRRAVAATMQSSGKRIESSLRHAEPVPLRLHVNDSYPENVPLQSTPPSLLTNLPPLPKEVEYRVAGHDLILLDAKANLVVDLIENIIP